MGEAPDTRSRQ